VDKGSFTFMMTPNEIFKQVILLPYEERKKLLKKLEDVLKKESLANRQVSKGQSRENLIAERKTAVDKLRGIASVLGKKPPTDEEWREKRTDYILEKYK